MVHQLIEQVDFNVRFAWEDKIVIIISFHEATEHR
jgi:hypothetical protein